MVCVPVIESIVCYVVVECVVYVHVIDSVGCVVVVENMCRMCSCNRVLFVVL